MRKPFVIGEKEYRIKKDAINHYSSILNSYNFGQSLNENDFNDLVDLLEGIPDFNPHDFSEIGANAFEAETRYIKPPQPHKYKMMRYEDAEDLAANVLINKGDTYYCIVGGSFIFGDFIEALIVKYNIKVKKMTISTLSLNQENVLSLANLLNGEFIDELNLIVSSHFYSSEKFNLVKYIYETLDKVNKFQLAVAATHCKTCIFETLGGKKIVMHGSANLSSSGNIEQFVIEENEELYIFNDEYQMGIIEHFKTIQKSGLIYPEGFIETGNSEVNTEPKIDDKFESEDEEDNQNIIIEDIKVARVQFSKKCFEVFFKDRSSQYISYLRIINKQSDTPEGMFNIACRNSITTDLRSVKQQYFDDNSVKGQVMCQETKLLSKWEDLVVDHRQPNTFSVIVDRFKELKNIVLSKMEYSVDDNNCLIFKNEDFMEAFRKYHKDKASLRIVRKECNLSRSGMARIKRSRKDLTIK